MPAVGLTIRSLWEQGAAALRLWRVLLASRGKRLLLIASHTGRLGANALGLALAAKRSEDFFPVFLGGDIGAKSGAGHAGIPAFFAGGRCARCLWKRARVIAYTSFYRGDFALGETSAFRVFLWHGMPIKGIGAFDPLASDRITEECDLAIATSDFTSRIMSDSFGLPRARVVIAGEPKTDPLPEILDWGWTAGIRRQYDHLVAYVPTWREKVVEVAGRARLRGDDEAMAKLVRRLVSDPRLRTLIEERRAAFILRTHRNNAFLPEVSPPFFLMPDTSGEVAHLLAHADVVIGDYSSVVVDALLFPSDLALWCEDLDDYTRLRSMPYFDFRKTFGWAIKNTLDELVSWLDGRLKGEPLAISEQQGLKRCRALFHTHRAGGAGERLLAAVRSRLAARQ